ncbi:MAG: hypothetical protein ACFFD7_04825 [Candidatus Thorarchaeota archaeon]
MDPFENEFNNLKNSSNPETVNDFLIRISENPKEEYLSFLEYFLKEADEELYNKIKLNLIFVLGEIGNVTKLSNYYFKKLSDIFYTSDRWVRNEIIQTISKISKNTKLNEEIFILLGNALNDDYLPVKKGVLELLKSFESLPNSIMLQFFRVLNTKDTEILDLCRQVFESVPLKLESIYRFLDTSENYKVLKPRAIRSLLLIEFKLITALEAFRRFIRNSGWEDNYKLIYLKEIDTLQSILLKTL